MKTFSAKESEVIEQWFEIDVANLVAGRVAAEVAKLLRGKNKPSVTPHMESKNHVIIVNAEKIALTGNKTDKKKGEKHYYHTGFPGGIKERSIGWMLEGKHPERVFKLAVKRMLPKDSPMARVQFSNLHVYNGPVHPHGAQKPVVLDVASWNRKNTRIQNS